MRESWQAACLGVPEPQLKQREICVGAVAVHNEAVLLVRQSPGHNLAGQWTIPWGTLEDDEQPSEAAVREVVEESGLLTTVDGLLGVQAIPPPWAGQIALLFRCRFASGSLTPDGRETDSYISRQQSLCANRRLFPWSRLTMGCRGSHVTGAHAIGGSWQCSIWS